MNDTIFGKIIRGEIPATKVYEDERCLACMDINAQSKGHVLLIPKEQVGRIQYVPDELLQYLMVKAKELVISMIEGLGCEYVQIEIVGKGIPEHFHIHLIPRMENDDVPESPYKAYEPGEAELFAEKIKHGLKI